MARKERLKEMLRRVHYLQITVVTPLIPRDLTIDDFGNVCLGKEEFEGKKVFISSSREHGGFKYPRRHGEKYNTMDNFDAIRLALGELGQPMMRAGKPVVFQ